MLLFNDWLQSLSLLVTRWYLVYPMWITGSQKILTADGTAIALEFSYDIPFPQFMAYLTGLGEVGGALGLLLGIWVRFSAFNIALITIIAASTIHLNNGWAADHNGVEMCTIYAIMSLVLLSHGGGSILTFQPWINDKCKNLRNYLPFGKWED